MDDYISRGAVLAKAYWHGDSCTQSNPYPDGVEAVDVSAIEQISAADVRPVVHATWRDDADKIDKRFNKHDYFCPVCNTRADAFVAGSEDWYCYFAPNFCPHCGADMRE